MPQPTGFIMKMIPDRRILFGAGLHALLISPWSLSQVAWVCLVPWLLTLDDCQDRTSAILQSLWFNIFYGVFAFYFVTVGFHAAANLTYWQAALFSLPFYFLHQPQFLLFPFLWFFWRKHHKRRKKILLLDLLWLSFCYVALETLIPKVFRDTLGVAFSNAAWLRQAADLGGVSLLTFVIVFTNLALFNVIKEWRQRAWQPLLLAGLMCLALLSYGALRQNQIQALLDSSRSVVEAVLVQANIPDALKERAIEGDPSARRMIEDEYMDLSQRAVQKYPNLDFLLWPETAYPEVFRGLNGEQIEARSQKFEDFVLKNKKTIAFGGFDSERRKGAGFNSLLIIDPEARTQIYRKSILLPGGEYWPLADGNPWILEYLPKSSNFTRGPGPSLLHLPTGLGDLQVNAVICYESIFPDYALQGARLGSRLILNVTDGSWFEPSNEPLVHLGITTFNSVITRLPQLVSTNSGVSTLILPTGEWVQPSPSGVKALLNYKIPIIEPVPTLVKTWGDWFPWLSVGIAVLGFILLGGAFRISPANRSKNR